MLKIFTVALVTLAIATPAIAGNNKNNQFKNWEHNRTYNYNYNYNYNYKYKNRNNNINPWAAAGVGFLGGLIVGSANQNRYAAPQYAPAPQYGVPVQGINTVPGCFYAAFVDMYGRQYFQQVCR